MFQSLSSSRRTFSWIAAIFALLGPIGQGPAWAADIADAPAPEKNSARLEQARLHFSNGVELLQRQPPNYQDAFPQFLAAYDKSERSWKVLGNLGLCALMLERDGEALDYYKRYLDEGGEAIDPEERDAIERELLLIEGNLVEVTLSSPFEEVQVQVSRQGSEAPPQGYLLTKGTRSLGLRAGSHTLTAQSGAKTQTWKVVLTPGQSAAHVFDFAPAPGAEAPPAAATGGGMSPLGVAGLLTATVGTAALIGGAVTGVLVRQRESDARDRCEGSICPIDARSDFESARSLATLTNVLLIGGGALAATGVTLVILGGNTETSEASAARLVLTPRASLEGGGLWASGAF